MDQKIFADRRKKICDKMLPNSVAFLSAAEEKERNYEINYPFRQDSDFYYVTGFNEPEAIAVFIKKENTCEYILFNRTRDPEIEKWVGYRVGQDGAVKNYGVDQAFPIELADEKIPEMLKNVETIYYPFGRNQSFDRNVQKWMNTVRSFLRTGVNAPNQIINIENILHAMRLIKQPEEVEQLKKAADISVQAFKRAMKACKPGLSEYELDAELVYEFYKNGAHEQSFGSIVAGGGNACILHYQDNKEELKDGELVLIDAGCSYDYYAADISRTFPINGKFSDAQREIYELVLKAQMAAIEMAKPGNHYFQLHETAARVITEGLVGLGLLKGDIEALFAEEAFAKFYPHKIGHWLGVDVHDRGTYKVADDWRVLEPGMTMTVEPGIYISEGTAGVDPKYWNIGVRIEDDILITNDGCEVLTKELPKTVPEIENFLKK